MSRSIADQASEPDPPLPDLPDELFPAPVRTPVFRLLWTITLLLVIGLGIVGWRYLTVVGQ